MSTSVKFTINELNVHKGTAYAFLNILRPPPYLAPVNDGNISPTVSDRALGAWVAANGTWQASTPYAKGTVIVDNNGNAQICTTAGTTGLIGTFPAFSKVALATTADNGTLMWTCLGRVGTAHTSGGASQSGNWAPSFADVLDDMIRDANGNIQVCIVPGTSAAAAPTWGTTMGALVQETAGPLWMCTGPTISGGSTEGNFEFDMACKTESFTPDQATLPLSKYMVSEEAMIGAELREVSAALFQFTTPHATVVAITDAAMPAARQSYNAIVTGGLVLIPTFCVCVLSPRPVYSQAGSTAFITGVLQKSSANDSKTGFGFTRQKVSGLKGAWGAMHIDSWPAGARGAAVFGI